MREFMQNLTPEQREAMRQMRGAGGQGQARSQTGQGTTGTDTTARTQRVIIRNQ